MNDFRSGTDQCVFPVSRGSSVLWNEIEKLLETTFTYDVIYFFSLILQQFFP
ncbi:MAG: hypothetical protein ACI8ZB_004874 [Desulforhopalus sp.]|jgi:hypothetical protein